MKKTVITGAILAAACLGTPHASQTARDNGFLTINLAAGERKIVANPFVRPVVHEGTVTGSGPSSISESGAFTAGAFNEAAGDNKYELEITSGRHIGLILPVLSNSVSTVFLNGTIPAQLKDGSTFVIRKSWTPGSLFGTNVGSVTNAGMKSATTANAATQLQILDPLLNQFTLSIFFRSTSGEWRIASAPTTATNLYDVRLGPPAVFVLAQGGSAGAATPRMVGEVRKTRTLFPAGGGTSNYRTLIANPNHQAITLAAAGLFNTNGESSATNSVKAATTANVADELTKFNGQNNTTASYFRHTTSGDWRISGTTTPSNTVAIAAGEGAILKRNSTGQAHVAIDPTF